jgi:UDP:flavonoid glycosyltransferase YjiC (YdhE family)
MSRFLFVVPPLVGHINPTVAVADCLVATGHEVAWAGRADVLRPLVGADRMIYHCPTGSVAETRPAGLRGPAALRFLWESFLVPLAEAMAPGVRAAVDAFAPDLLVVDQQAMAGGLVADRLGLRWATSATTTAELVDPLASLPKVKDWQDSLLADLCRRFGDPTLSSDPRYSRSLVLAFSTSALTGPIDNLAGPVVFVGTSIAEDRTGFDCRWPDPPARRPTVLVTLGTANVDVGARFLTECAAALASRRVSAVIVDPSGVLGPQPSHIHVRSSVPQLAILAGTDAVICHAGHNTVSEALWHGIPLVLAPIRDDQPIVADQVVEAGAGIRLRFNRATADQIGAAVDRIITEPSYRDAAGRIRESLRAEGGASAAASALATLAMNIVEAGVGSRAKFVERTAR